MVQQAQEQFRKLLSILLFGLIKFERVDEWSRIVDRLARSLEEGEEDLELEER